jgi:hypothetical protein
LNWKKIEKDKQKQPSSGTYSDWKEQIAEECFYQCIYCSIHEAQFGGIDHYHIEHYKPKSIERFKGLENDIMNLFYACPICNRFKSNDWPNDAEDLNLICYPDPSKINYTDLFEVDYNNFKVEGRYLSTRYMTIRLYLNRPQLIYERREDFLKIKENELRKEIKTLMNDVTDISLLKKAYELVDKLSTHLSKRDKIRPYKLTEIRK